MRKVFPSSLLSTIVESLKNAQIQVFLAEGSSLGIKDPVRGDLTFSGIATSVDHHTKPSHKKFRVFVRVVDGRTALHDCDDKVVQCVAESVLHEYWERRSGHHYESAAAELLCSSSSQTMVPERIRHEMRGLSKKRLEKLQRRRGKLIMDYLKLDVNQ